jgi:hypothetical protein
MKKEEFKGLLVLMDGDLRITLFTDGWGYCLTVYGVNYESYGFNKRTKAYLDAKKVFQELISV